MQEVRETSRLLFGRPNIRTKMTKEFMSFTLAALLSLAQATPVQVKVESHSLGGTAEQFFSESKEGVMLNACATRPLCSETIPIPFQQ